MHKQKLKAFTKYQIIMIVILSLLQFTIVLDFMIISPLGDLLMKKLGLSTSQFGSVVSAYAFSAGITGILAAGFADKFDRKKLVLVFYAGFILATLFCGIAWSYHTLFIARLITGIFAGVVAAMILAIVTDVFEFEQRGRVVGFVQMSFAGSQILGVPLGIVLANAWGWQSTFFMVTAMAFLICIAIVVHMKPQTAHLRVQQDRTALEHLWHTIRKRDYHIGFATTATLAMGGFMLMPFSAVFLVNNVDISQAQLPIVFFCTGVSSMLIMPVIGRLSDRIDKFLIFVTGSAIACIFIVVYTNLTPVHITVVILINIILFMGIMSRMVPATALMSAVPEVPDRGAYMSINSSLQQMTGGFAAMLAAVVIVQRTKTSPLEHFDTVGYIVVGFIILCAYLMWQLARMLRHRSGVGKP